MNSITFCTSEGEPESTCQIETRGFAMLRGYNGRLFSMSEDGHVRVYDRIGKAIGQLPDPSGNSDHFFTRGGKELWVVQYLTRKVERFELPK